MTTTTTTTTSTTNKYCNKQCGQTFMFFNIIVYPLGVTVA